jgi:Ca-activated chloride channel family protein
MEFFKGYQRDNNDEVVITKLNQAGLLEEIAKATKEGLCGWIGNTKEVLEYIKNSLNTIQNKFEGDTNDFQSQFQWF